MFFIFVDINIIISNSKLSVIAICHAEIFLILVLANAAGFFILNYTLI